MAADIDTPGDDTEPEVVVKTCPECSQVFTGSKSGGNGAAFKMARHRRTEHGVAGQGRRARRQPGAPTDADYEATPVLAGVRDIASAVGSRKGIPTANDLAEGLGRGLSLVTIAVSSFMVESDGTIPDTPAGEAERDRLVDYLSLPNAGAVKIMAPVGRAIAPTSINRRFGRQIVDNVDLAASVSELGILAMHWRKYLSARKVYPAAGTPLAGPMGAGPPAAAVPTAPTMDTTPAATTPPPVQGRVLSGEEVQRLVAERESR